MTWPRCCSSFTVGWHACNRWTSCSRGKPHARRRIFATCPMSLTDPARVHSALAHPPQIFRTEKLQAVFPLLQAPPLAHNTRGHGSHSTAGIATTFIFTVPLRRVFTIKFYTLAALCLHHLCPRKVERGVKVGSHTPPIAPVRAAFQRLAGAQKWLRGGMSPPDPPFRVGRPSSLPLRAELPTE